MISGARSDSRAREPLIAVSRMRIRSDLARLPGEAGDALLVLRPVPGTGRAETPVKGLYLAAAAAPPGGGVHGACGANAARAALGHARLGRLLGFVPGTSRP